MELIGESVCTARKFLATFVAKHKSVNKDVIRETHRGYYMAVLGYQISLLKVSAVNK